MNCELEDKIFSITPSGFESLALEIFRFQYVNNTLYRSFVDTLNIRPASVSSITDIPFLPVGFFKNHLVVSGEFKPEVVFESSGTTQTGNSRHLLRSASVYRESFINAFQHFYGPVADWCIVGLLPSYLERQHSSLVMMVDELVKLSGNTGSGFYLYEHEKLKDLILKNESNGTRTLLIGVTFAMLDLAAHFHHPLKNIVIMETGGMKGRRKEITRGEVHDILKNAWQLDSIHSEYGMTELLSQAYSKGDGIFKCPSWMKVVVREEDDPLTVRSGTTDENGIINGLVNVIDLANIYSCSFIATDDIGKLHPDGSFEVIGRMDSSDVRGCSLMYDMPS
jgi:hypothetical protein